MCTHELSCHQVLWRSTQDGKHGYHTQSPSMSSLGPAQPLWSLGSAALPAEDGLPTSTREVPSSFQHPAAWVRQLLRLDEATRFSDPGFCLRLRTYLCLDLSIYLFFYLSISIYLCLSLSHLYLSLSISFDIDLSPYLYKSIYLPTSISICLVPSSPV